MACQVDLGGCLLRHTSSPIQLRFTATASLGPQMSQLGSSMPIDINQWLDTVSIWVVESPGLEMRFRIRVDPGLENAATALVSGLGEKLCSSSVWTNLGLGIVFKSCGGRSNDIPGVYCLTFGLYREHTSLPAPGRALPAVMKNAPDAHAPTDTTTVHLDAIDILLEYGIAEDMCHQQISQSASLKEPLDQTWYEPCHYPTGTREPTATNTFPSPHDSGWARSDHSCLFSSDGPYSISGYEDSSQSSSLHSMLFLLESALRRLIFSSTTKCPQIKTIGENRLQSLSKLAPAVFLPGYREAMNQRAVSIPVITRALKSMLENSPNPIIQGRLPILLRESGQNHSPSSDSHPRNLDSIIQSALWRIAQTQIRKSKPRKQLSFLLSEPVTEHLLPSGDSIHQTPINPDHAIQDEDLDSYLGSELDYTEDVIAQPEMTSFELLQAEDDMLLSTSSGSSFRDISESTQTTVDFPTQPCASGSSHGDSEMLFADCDLMEL